MTERVADVLVVVVSLIAIVTDAKWHKIPNWLTFTAIGLGLLVNAFEGWSGLIRSAGGLLLAFSIMLPLFALDLLKAGDVKLVMAWGTIKGLGQPAWQSFALWAFLYGALFGGLMALVALACKKALPDLWKRLQSLLGLMLISPKSLTDVSGSSATRAPMPYGIALSLGAMIALTMELMFGKACPFIAN